MDDWLTDPEPYGILETVVRQTTPVVRPDDVLSALRVVAGLAPLGTARAVRLAQGRLDDGGGLADPFAPERAAAGARRGEPAVRSEERRGGESGEVGGGGGVHRKKRVDRG